MSSFPRCVSTQQRHTAEVTPSSFLTPNRMTLTSPFPISLAHYRYCSGGRSIAVNVSAVYEAPELAARSAEGFPRPFTIDTSHGLPWQGAKRRRVNPACYPMLVSPVPGYPSSWRHHADERHQRVHEPSIDLQWNQRFLRLDGSSSPFTGGLSFPARLSIWRAFFSLARDARSLK